MILDSITGLLIEENALGGVFLQGAGDFVGNDSNRAIYANVQNSSLSLNRSNYGTELRNYAFVNGSNNNITGTIDGVDILNISGNYNNASIQSNDSVVVSGTNNVVNISGFNSNVSGADIVLLNDVADLSGILATTRQTWLGTVTDIRNSNGVITTIEGDLSNVIVLPNTDFNHTV